MPVRRNFWVGRIKRMFTTNYDIYTPVLHNEQHTSLRTNRLLGDITYDFNTDALKDSGLNGVSFCFFVNWNADYLSGTVDPHIWIKKGLIRHENKQLDANAPLFAEKFFSVEPLDEVRKKSSFFKRYDLELSYTIIEKMPVQDALPDDRNVIIELLFEDPGFRKEIIKYGQLKELLVRYSGRPIAMGKPLNYYETELEKILSCDRSGRSAPFPGDCDLLLYDNNLKCRAIIEFKKRTSSGASIPIAGQTIANYFCRDALKYRRLNLLRNYFEQRDSSNIPLLNVFYSVANDEDDETIKIEAISHELSGDAGDCFELPNNADKKTVHSLILQHILSFVRG